MKFPFKIKKLDLFIIKTFSTNLMATFLICLFIFIMQLLWRWVDELVEKGIDFTILAQFFSLSSITLVSQALPLAILLASLMTFGSFGEKLELLAMKAAGIPLFRIMRPLIIMCTILSFVSFYFQNVVSPYAQMKLYTIMYSIKQTSPESEIPEGIFYDKLEGYNIYVQHKDKETGTLHNVMIYDMSAGFENANILVSDSARITTSSDESHMILSMFSGEQFSNLTDQQVNKNNVPYRRETFSRKDVLIEIEGGFEMKDASIMKAKPESKNIIELETAADSLGHANDSIGLQNWKGVARTTFNSSVILDSNDSVLMKRNNVYNINVDSVFNTASKHSKLVWKRSQLNKIKQLKVDYEIKHNIMRSLDKDLNKHKFIWWEKFTLSLACLVFFFIGAPLGAIVRKGGLGYPVLISVATFILYYLMNTSGMKMAREGEWHIWYGAWLSTMVLAPLGVFFTYQSNKDSGIFNGDAIKAFFMTLLAIPEKRHLTLKEVIIDDPDYNDCVKTLDSLCNFVRKYKKDNRLRKLPHVKKIFFNESDTSLDDFNTELEELIEKMSNSRNKKIIIQLNMFPIIAYNAISSPFKRRWLNIMSIVLFPVGTFIYFRAFYFRIRLLKDLVKTEIAIKEIIRIIEKEKLI